MAAAAEQKEDFAEVFSLAPLPSTKRGYAFHVYAAPKGPYKGWAAYGHGRFVILRNLADPKQSKIFAEHTDRVNVARWSPNGEWIASGDDSGKVIVWSTLNWNVKNTVPACSSVMDIDWCPEGKRIVAAGDGKQAYAKVFSWDSGNNLGTIDAHQQPILTVQYRPQRPYFICTGSEDLMLQWYKGPPFKFDHSFKGLDRYPNRAQWSPGACEHLVSVSSCGQICVFDGKEGQLVRKIQDKANGHTGAIYHFSWSPDGKRFLTAGADKTAKLWDFESGTVLATYAMSEKPGVPDMQQSTLWTGEGLVASFSLSGAINWLHTGDVKEAVKEPVRPASVWQGHKAPVSGLATLKDAKEFYTADSDGQLVAWNIDSGLGRWFTGKGHDGKGIRAIAIQSDGEFVLTAGADDKLRWASTKTYDWSEDAVVELGGLPTFLCAGNKTPELAVVALAQDKLVLVRGGRKVAATLGLDYSPFELALSPDDSQLAVAGKDGMVRVYAVGEADLKQTAKWSEDKHAKSAVGLSWSPCGTLVCSTAKDASVHIRDAATGKLRNPTEWTFHSATVNGSRWSPNGRRLATFSEDESVIVWKDLEGFKHERDTLGAAHKGGVQHAQWLNDRVLLTVGGDNTVRAWSYKNFE